MAENMQVQIAGVTFTVMQWVLQILHLFQLTVYFVSLTLTITALARFVWTLLDSRFDHQNFISSHWSHSAHMINAWCNVNEDIIKNEFTTMRKENYILWNFGIAIVACVLCKEFSHAVDTLNGATSHRCCTALNQLVILFEVRRHHRKWYLC